MILRFFRRNDGDETIQRLYGAIVARSRDPAFYTDYKVPDSIEGRFEMILVHAFLLFHRLKDEDEARRVLGQGVFDAFCADMDANLREMGVGDLTVPKKMKKVAEAFYGRIGAYEPPVDAGDAEALAEAVLRNVHASSAEGCASSPGLGDLYDGGGPCAEGGALRDLRRWRVPAAFAGQARRDDEFNGDHAMTDATPDTSPLSKPVLVASLPDEGPDPEDCARCRRPRGAGRGFRHSRHSRAHRAGDAGAGTQGARCTSPAMSTPW